MIAHSRRISSSRRDLMDHGEEEGAYAKLPNMKRPSGSLAFFPRWAIMTARAAVYKAFLTRQLLEINPQRMTPKQRAAFTLYYENDPITMPKFSGPGAEAIHLRLIGVTIAPTMRFANQNCFSFPLEQGTRWWTNTSAPLVENELNARRKDASIDNIFVFMHHPIYTTACRRIARSANRAAVSVKTGFATITRRCSVNTVSAWFRRACPQLRTLLVPDDRHHTCVERRAAPGDYPFGDGIHLLTNRGGGGPLGDMGLRTDGNRSISRQAGADRVSCFAGRKCLKRELLSSGASRCRAANRILPAGGRRFHDSSAVRPAGSPEITLRRNRLGEARGEEKFALTRQIFPQVSKSRARISPVSASLSLVSARLQNRFRPGVIRNRTVSNMTVR